jgi:short-subunit dehydrogenase
MSYQLIAGHTFLVTGAAQGIGRAIALQLAKSGAHLALVDVNGEQLNALRELLPAAPTRISLHVLDLTGTDAAEQVSHEVLQLHAGLDGLINNAGATVIGNFSDTSAEDFDWLMQLNFAAPVRLTRSFLPILLRGQDPVIVNISSVFGLIAPAGQSAYASSKFALRGFSEALMHELQGGPVRVLTVHPGGIRTAIVRNARAVGALSPKRQEELDRRFTNSAQTTPDQAAQRIVAAIAARRRRLLIGADARVIDALQRLAPVGHWRLLARLLR